MQKTNSKRNEQKWDIGALAPNSGGFANNLLLNLSGNK